MSYTPFGPEWQKEMKELPIKVIEHITSIKKQEGEKKAAFITRIAEEKNPNLIKENVEL